MKKSHGVVSARSSSAEKNLEPTDFCEVGRDFSIISVI